MTHTNSQSPESIFRVNVRVKKHKTQGQMLADFSEAVIAKRALPPIPQGFIPHDGGHCPVAEGTAVRVVYRDGKLPAFFRQGKSQEGWMHCSKPNDIIAYRPQRGPDFNVEAGKFYITASGERVGPMIGAVYKWINGRFSNSDPEWENNGSRRRNTDSDLLALAADQASPMVSA